MQCRILFAFVISCSALLIAAAPVPASPELVEVARAPEPVPEPACRLYSCIWCVLLHVAILLSSLSEISAEYRQQKTNPYINDHVFDFFTYDLSLNTHSPF
ncbi:hypothetical protein K438DRAFT_1957374 [Mycena galopus ATCC 62051]|nr:hypothetical protein K438DRAFT_1957374 [Mycena galopus ATCC 62051]